MPWRPLGKRVLVLSGRGGGGGGPVRRGRLPRAGLGARRRPQAAQRRVGLPLPRALARAARPPRARRGQVTLLYY